MRLTSEQSQQIKREAAQVFGQPVEVVLFGSRVWRTDWSAVMIGSAREAMRQRMEFLHRIVDKEIEHLAATTERLFGGTETLTEQTVRQWIEDPILSERLDAFVSRFSRLQDTLGDKLIPVFKQPTAVCLQNHGRM